jgi:hypothetical protein
LIDKILVQDDKPITNPLHFNPRGSTFTSTDYVNNKDYEERIRGNANNPEAEKKTPKPIKKSITAIEKNKLKDSLDRSFNNNFLNSNDYSKILNANNMTRRERRALQRKKGGTKRGKRNKKQHKFKTKTKRRNKTRNKIYN